MAVVSLAVVLVALAVFTAVWREGTQPLSAYTGDPAAVLGGPWSTGILAHIAMLGWWFGAVSCGMVAIQLGRRSARGRLLAHAAVFCGLLGVDDMFQFHEAIGPELGIPAPVTRGVYAAVLLTLIAVHHRQLRHLAWRLLIASGVLLGVSVVIDDVRDHVGTAHTALDGYVKFTGIVLWGAFWTATAVASAPRAQAPARTETAAAPPPAEPVAVGVGPEEAHG